MSFLSWITGQIVIEDATVTAADIQPAVPRADVRVSLLHEYVHFLQLVTSVGGIRLLADLVDMGVRGALLLSGTITVPQVVDRTYEITPLLRGLPAYAWREHPGVTERRHETMDELDVLIEPLAHPYTGRRGPWEVDRQLVTHNSYSEPLYGFVVARATGPLFRPFSIGFLAESMARRLDRWFAARTDPDHLWTPGETETEFYNGLLSILARPAFDELRGADLEQIVVVLSGLALATPRPDAATALMLERLSRPIDGGPLVANVAAELRTLLLQRNLLHADHYNGAIWDVMQGVARLMDRAEYLDIHGRLVQVHAAANRFLQNPLFFARPDVDWDTFRAWLALFPPPPVLCSSDATTASNIDGIGCAPFATPFLSEVERALLARPRNENAV